MCWVATIGDLLHLGQGINTSFAFTAVLHCGNRKPAGKFLQRPGERFTCRTIWVLMNRAGYGGFAIAPSVDRGLSGLPACDQASCWVNRVVACNPASPAAMSGEGGQGVLRESAGTSASKLACLTDRGGAARLARGRHRMAET